MVVQHNISAMNANRMLSINTRNVSSLAEKLSSGYRINKASDDAAGLSISEKMRKQIRGLTRAATNSEDGISCVQTADGALNEVHDMLQRMNELCVQAANGVMSSTDRQYIQDELDELISEVDRVAESTKFNDLYLLNGDSDNGVIKKYIETYKYSEVITSTTVTAADLDNYTSYIDSTGATHYVLGEGYFAISSDVTGVILDVSGNTEIHDSTLKNVSINCASDTALSILNLTIDNSAFTHTSTGGVGSAIIFNDGDSTLNCYGDNVLKGGCYTYLDSNGQAHAGCGIEMKNDVVLSINGTDTSTLNVENSEKNFSSTSSGSTYVSISAAIGGVRSSFSGKNSNCVLNINSGNITLSSNQPGMPTISVLDSSSINLNGGNIYADDNFLSVSNSTINLNGSNITQTSQSNNSFISCSDSTLNIYSGNLNYNSYITLNNSTYNQTGGNVIDDYVSNDDSPIELISGSNVYVNGGYLNLKASTTSKPIYLDTSDCHVYIDGTQNDSFADGTESGGYSYATYGTKQTTTSNGSYTVDWRTLLANISDLSQKQLYDSNGLAVSEIKLNDYFNEKGDYSGGLYSSSKANVSDEVVAGKDTTIWDYVNQNLLKINDNLEISVLAGDDSNPSSTIEMDINSLSSTGLDITLLKSKYVGIVDDTGALATDAINVIAAAIQRVSEQRSYLGAIQNRLEHTIKNLDNVVENTTSAESQIRDTDMAKEMVAYSNAQIVSQSAQAMLGQANQANQGILSLMS